MMTVFTGVGMARQQIALRVVVTVPASVRSHLHKGGRLMFVLSKLDQRAPRWRPQIIYGIDLNNWDGSTPYTIDTRSDKLFTFGANSLVADPSHVFYFQVLYKQNLKQGIQNAPGNICSYVDSCIFTHDTTVNASLADILPAPPITKSKFVKTVVIRSNYLSEFWHKPTYMRASILLPSGYFEHPGKIYPIVYRCPGLNGQWDWVSRLLRRPFRKWWFLKSTPQVIYVFLDARGPYGDTYEVNSANNGPVGTALTKELMPAVEKAVDYTQGSKLRFLVGYSTGGWTSLGLQIFYPDMFSGVWSYSADPVTFEAFGLTNIYKDTSMFYNKYGYLQPADRNIYGEPTKSMKWVIGQENALSRTNDYRISGKQYGCYNAAWSPRGKDGLPEMMFDPYTGRINRTVAVQWKKYDLKYILQKNWKTLGPKLRGKLHIWTGEMDGMYSNVATWLLFNFLKSTTDPKSDAEMVYVPMAGHGASWSDEHVLELVAARAARIEAEK